MEKRKRAAAKGKFTRQETHLTEMINNKSAKVIVTPQYEKFVECWNSLEDAHDGYMEVADFDIEEDDDGLKYLEDPSKRYRILVNRYSEFLKESDDADRTERKQSENDSRAVEEASRKQIEAEKKAAEDDLHKQQLELSFTSAEAELNTSIDSFNRFVLGLKDSVTTSSDSVKRSELERVDVEFKSVKGLLVKLAGVDQTKDITDIRKKFVDEAEKVYLDFHKDIIQELKDIIPTSGGSGRNYSTKKEAVKLPTFAGDEMSSPSPFLSFPIWFKQWEAMIPDYDVKYRARLLCDHIDVTARSKFTGFEDNFPEAMKRLEQFYGDSSKVVKCVMKEVQDPDAVAEDDYRGLVEYADILENNFNRLTSMNLQHEMSNTSVMSVIVKKFPRVIEERWHDHLLDRSSDEKSKPFPVFITWLARQKEKWACMVSSEVGRRGDSSHYVNEQSGTGKECVGCGDSGHIRRNCPKNKNNDRDSSKPRKTPKVKKFWCALHKDDKSRKCSTDSCGDLRKMTDIARRVTLLKENKDCIHCCGDHKSEDCRKKERICGGGKEGRGCSKQHKLHELFCSEAKVCMVVLHTESTTVDNDKDEEGVVLCIMKIRAPKGRTACTFWDTAPPTLFVNNSRNCVDSNQKHLVLQR